MLERIRKAVSFAASSTTSPSRTSAWTGRAQTSSFLERAYTTAVEAGAREAVVVDTLGIATPGGGRVPRRARVGAGSTCRSTGTATTTSGSRPPPRSPRCRRARRGSTARSTAWASAPATRACRRSRSRSTRSTASARTCGSSARARCRRACASSPATSSSRGSRSSARRSSAASRAPWRRSSTTRRRSSRTRPTLVGAERSLVLGKKSGLDSIRIKAAELGLDVPDEQRAELLARVKRLGAEKRGLVTDEEFRQLARTL